MSLAIFLFSYYFEKSSDSIDLLASTFSLCLVNPLLDRIVNEEVGQCEIEMNHIITASRAFAPVLTSGSHLSSLAKHIFVHIIF